METEGFYMAEKRWRTWETVGLLVVLAAGNLLHFVYDWTGQSPIAAPLAAVNESTWEHMKLFITPWVLWSLVECIALRGHGALLPARGLGLLTGLAAIPALFYTYQGILGRGIMWVDVLIFQLAVLLAFWVSWSVQARRVLDGPVWQILGGVTLLAGDAMFPGDTLFAGSMGRTDLPGGNDAQMLASLRRLAQIEGDYTVYPGHMNSTTLAREKAMNPYLRHALR
jgi:hypothetical protein